MSSVLVPLLFHSAVSTFAGKYHLDPTWNPQFPFGSNTFSAVGVYNDHVFVTQRGNVSIPPVLHLSSTTGALLSAWGEHTIALAQPKKSWGAHGLAIESCNHSCVPGDKLSFLRVWVEDFTNHTVTAFASSGDKLLQIGTPGKAGNGTHPLQFGNVADAVIVPGLVGPLSVGPSFVYATDGDGGDANRVVKIRVSNPQPSTPGPTVEWVTGHIFNNPHSIALHARSQLLVIADRGQMALKLVDSVDGKVLGTFDCGLTFGGSDHGVPFGVRTWSGDAGNTDLLFVASMDNPQDHKYQYISVLDVSGLNRQDGVHSKCRVVQTLTIDPREYSGPHLLGVSASSGDLYVTLVANAPLSTVLRFRRGA